MVLDPTIIVLFGGAGDLVWRKLIPSLFDLHREGRMPSEFAILAVDRLPFRDQDLRTRFLGGVEQFARNKKVKKSDWNAFARPVLEAWAESTPRNFPNYAAGTWGPKAADALLAHAGHAWRPIA